MKLRNYAPGDEGQLAEVYRDAVRGLGPRAYSPAQVDAWARYPEDMAEFAARLGRGLTLVGEADGVAVAFGQLDPADHVSLLFCRAARAGQGWGGRILAELERAARNAGQDVLRTEASRLARPFFERHGFRVLRTELAERHGERFERFVMEKTLD